MVDIIILLLLISFVSYIYINEKAFQKGKIPFVNKHNEKDCL
jgi:hypothetical protein